MSRLMPFLVSLPERVLRSVTALASGLVREIGEVTLPQAVRHSQLYQNLVEATLRFLIAEVGQVQGVYPPSEEKLAEGFLLRRTAGSGIELIGLLTFYASPVWVLAALADASGSGRYLIREIAAALKAEGLLDRDTDFSSVDQMLDGLEACAGRLAATLNAPPLDVAALRQEWAAVRQDLSRIAPQDLPSIDVLRDLWTGIKQTARTQHRTLFEVSSLMALSALRDLPHKARWLLASARLAAGTTRSVVASVLLDHYRTTLKRIRETGYVRYAMRQFRPYLYGAVSQFSPQRRSRTERWLQKRRSRTERWLQRSPRR